MIREELIIAGAGGQGALRIGQMIAYAGMAEGLETTWLPSYGAEMRGGTANCNVIVCERRIASPMVSRPNAVIAMNLPSLSKFESWVKPGGVLIYNSSAIEVRPRREDIRIVAVPADEIAERRGNPRGANMVLLGAWLAGSKALGKEPVLRVIRESFTGGKARFAEPNCRLVEEGMALITPSR